MVKRPEGTDAEFGKYGEEILTNQLAYTSEQHSRWDAVMRKAVNHSISGLTDMAGANISVSEITSQTVDVTQIPDKLGGAEKITVGILLAVEEKPGFHMALLHSPEAAYSIIDILLGQELGTSNEMGELELSTLGEMGNIMCSFFLNVMGDETGIQLMTTPPTVREDMTGAVLDYILAEIMMDTDEVDLLQTTYGTENTKVDGTFIVLPSNDFRLQAFEKGLAA